MNNAVLWLEGGLYTVIAIGAPLIETLGSDRPMTARVICLIVISSIVTGAAALKAFLSTSFSRATGDAVLVRDDLLKPGDKLFGPASEAGPQPRTTAP